MPDLLNGHSAEAIIAFAYFAWSLISTSAAVLRSSHSMRNAVDEIIRSLPLLASDWRKSKGARR